MDINKQINYPKEMLEPIKLHTKLMIPKYSKIEDVMVTTISYYCGAVKCRMRDINRTVPYDLEFDKGTKVWDVITALRDLNDGYETFFESDGAFVYQKEGKNMKNINIDGVQFNNFSEAITYLDEMKKHEDELAEAKRLKEKLQKEKNERLNIIMGVGHEFMQSIDEFESDYQLNLMLNGVSVVSVVEDVVRSMVLYKK